MAARCTAERLGVDEVTLRRSLSSLGPDFRPAAWTPPASLVSQSGRKGCSNGSCTNPTRLPLEELEEWAREFEDQELKGL